MLSHRLSPFLRPCAVEVFPAGSPWHTRRTPRLVGARDFSGAMRAGYAHEAPRAGRKEVSCPA
jgi:hypothetical protein